MRAFRLLLAVENHITSNASHIGYVELVNWF